MQKSGEKRILVAGDSITRGIPGINYLDMLIEAFPEAKFTNRGLGGDTLIGISNRLIRELSHAQYDIIILEAGHNDILVPTLKNKGWLHKLSYYYYINRGSIPTIDYAKFERIYEETILKAKMLSDAPIIVTTLSCLSEDLDAETNMNRNILNQIIKKVGEKQRCIVADVGRYFNQRLSKQKINDMLLSNFLNLRIFDLFRTETKKGATALSRKRGLELTIDGVHLNVEGARIYCDVIKECLEQLL